MAKTNELTGSQIGMFKELDLHTYVQKITDTRGPRVVVHEFPNRDGARIETLGRKPHKSQWELTYTGADWRKQILALVKSLDENPAGLLIHPIYGQMQVVCSGFDRAVVNLLDATNTVTFDLTFTEDQLDLGLQEQQGVAAKQSAVGQSVQSLIAAGAAYANVATQAAIAAMTIGAAAYAAAAFDASTTNTVDPSLPLQLNAVGAALTQVEQALLEDTNGIGTMQTYDAIAAAEVLYAACLELADQVALETTGFETYIVPGDTSIGVLVGLKYGRDALAVIDQILTLNADKILDATKIPAGTALTLPPPPAH